MGLWVYLSDIILGRLIEVERLIPCGWHHLLGWDRGLHQKDIVRWAQAAITLLLDCGRNVTSCLSPCLWEVPAMMDHALDMTCHDGPCP